MRTPITLLHALLASAAALALTSFLHAQTTTPSPPPSQTASLAPAAHLLHTFDFEETKLNNFETTPMFWTKVVGRGFPAYSAGRFDHDFYHLYPNDLNPTHNSFRLDIDSGSAAFRFLAPPSFQIPVGSTGDYLVLGFVKTANLHHARAQISAWFADENGNLLPNTESHSEPFASPPSENNPAPTQNPNDGWHVLHLFLPGPRAGTPLASQAKSLILQVGLLQPQILSTDSPASSTSTPLGRFQLYDQDIKGTAWFDDIAIYRLPRVAIEVPSTIPANLFQSSQPIALDLTVSDFSTPIPAASDSPTTSPTPSDHINVSLKITDTNGLLFSQESWTVPTTTESPDTPHKPLNAPWLHNYSHPPLPPGTYTASLDVADGATASLIARRQTQFAVLAPLSMFRNDSSDLPIAPEFGISASDWPLSAWPDLPSTLSQLGVGWVQIPAWRRDMSEDALRRRDPPFDALLSTLDRANIHTLFTFSELPTVLSQKITEARNQAAATAPAPTMTTSQLPVTNSDPLLSLLNADPALWRPYASFLVARYSNAYNRWEIGSQNTPFSGSIPAPTNAPSSLLTPNTTQYPSLYQLIHNELAALLSQPHILIPWNALFDFDANSYPNAALDLRIPSIIKPSQIPIYIKDFKTAAGDDLFLHIDPLDPAPYSQSDRLSDFAQRIIYARSTNPAATLIDLPLIRRPTLSSTGSHSEPLDLLIVYRTLVRSLGNSEYRREIPLGTNIHAFLFSRPNSGALALWTDNPDSTTLNIPLGDSPRTIELTGSSKTLPINPTTHLATVTLTNTPIIIDHIDAKLVELRSTFTIANPRLPAGAGVLRTEVQLANPYDEVINATLKLNAPKGWTIDPPLMQVAMSPHGTFHQPITLRYPFSESVGEKIISATLASDSIGPGGNGQPLALSYPVTISSSTVETDGFARLLPNGDLVVQQMITNISPYPLNAQAYALAPGFARQERFVLNLLPGQTIVKRFLFPLSSNVNFKSAPSPEALAASLTNKTISAGLRQSDGKTLITKNITIN